LPRDPDAGASVGEPADGGPPADASVARDGGRADAGPQDDAGFAADAGLADGGAADASSPVDASVIDAGGDAGFDAGVTDAGFDAGLATGDLDVTWIHGSANCGSTTDPAIQVHAYDADTYILRQSKCVNFEGPFLYLLFGDARVLLQDTGATSSAAAFPLRDTVEGLISQRLAGASRDTLELVVTHSHGHGDHVAADAQFVGQPNTTVVGTSDTDVADFFGISNWPTQTVSYDLGGRVVDVLPIPGHHAAHIALYDRDTGLLLTGDTLYPGYLFIQQWNTYRASIARLRTFAESVPITWVLGTHVEMTSSAGQAYSYGTSYQPDEHVLQLTLDTLIELDTALTAIGGSPMQQVHDDFIIFP
jgi:glyoxylase-like metal-dependent hydrolase (beta-lactamase superfamily II)